MKIKHDFKNLNLSELLEISNLLKGCDKKLEIGFFKEARYHNGNYVADVAKKNEFGTLKMPLRPFFRNAINKNKNKWLSILKNKTKENKDIYNSLQILGNVIRGDVVKSINDTLTPPNSPLTIAKKKSSHPLIDSGILRKSVGFKIQ